MNRKEKKDKTVNFLSTNKESMVKLDNLAIFLRIPKIVWYYCWMCVDIVTVNLSAT